MNSATLQYQLIWKSKVTVLIISILLTNSANSQISTNNYNELANTVLNLFNENQIVALGENHGRLNESNFRLSLIKHRNFPQIVDVIVVEFANPLYQDIIDDYVNGKNIPIQKLRKVWQNTTQVGGVWDSPVYEQFFWLFEK
ncbi:hypothetical protein [Pontimicrobium sp. SW4]|uniref:Haem-binding uptake Tiki superfamily ChaN domain-containing protein n=1 Tax=Pontimicrobium sp. SW4 TaxID=3153519 RepID=A0AAU7BQT0_9FLAO